MLEQGFVDRLILYTSPLRLGPAALPFAAGQPGPAFWEKQITARTQEAFQHGPGQDIRTTGYLHDPWSGM